MPTRNICVYNKYGFCKYLETCRKYHENKKFENSDCEIRDCPLRHPKMCKFNRDFGFCKFSEWCKFSHEVKRSMFVENDGVKNLEEKLEKVKLDLEKSSEKMSKLENEMKNISLKMSEKDLTVSKINKKYNTLKEKVTILFDMEPRLEIVEKKVDKIVNEPVQTKEAADNKNAENVGEIKCNQCDFVAKNKFGLNSTSTKSIQLPSSNVILVILLAKTIVNW